MAGQIIERGKGVWLVRVYLGTDPATGKRQYHIKTIHGSKKDAEAHLTRALRDRGTGRLTVGAEKLTIGALLDDLLLDYKAKGKRHDSASIVVEKHLRPAFGALPISRMTTARALEYVATRQRRGVANRTINRELALLRRALDIGAKSDPPKRVAPIPPIPVLEENKVRKGLFKDSEYRALLKALPDHLNRDHAALCTTMDAVSRTSEALQTVRADVSQLRQLADLIQKEQADLLSRLTLGEGRLAEVVTSHSLVRADVGKLSGRQEELRQELGRQAAGAPSFLEGLARAEKGAKEMLERHEALEQRLAALASEAAASKDHLRAREEAWQALEQRIDTQASAMRDLRSDLLHAGVGKLSEGQEELRQELSRQAGGMQSFQEGLAGAEKGAKELLERHEAMERRLVALASEAVASKDYLRAREEAWQALEKRIDAQAIEGRDLQSDLLPDLGKLSEGQEELRQELSRQAGGMQSFQEGLAGAEKGAKELLERHEAMERRLVALASEAVASKDYLRAREEAWQALEKRIDAQAIEGRDLQSDLLPDLGKLSEGQEELRQELSRQAGGMQSFQEGLAGAEKGAKELLERHEAMERRLVALASESAASKDYLRAREEAWQALEKRIDAQAIEGRDLQSDLLPDLGKLSEGQEELRQELSRQAAGALSFQVGLAGAEKGANELLERHEALERRLVTLASEAAASKDHLRAREEAWQALEKRIDAQASAMRALHSDLQHFGDWLERLRTALGRLEERFSIPVDRTGNPAQKLVARLAERMTRWWGRLPERRRASRSHIPTLCVYHWTGGVSTPHEVVDISEIGAYLETRVGWSLGTIVELTLQRMPGTEGNPADPHTSLHLMSKVVRSDPGGIAVRFIYTQPHERLHVREFLADCLVGSKTGAVTP